MEKKQLKKKEKEKKKEILKGLLRLTSPWSYIFRNPIFEGL
jgi:hypothetical protein